MLQNNKIFPLSFKKSSRYRKEKFQMLTWLEHFCEICMFGWKLVFLEKRMS